MRIFAWVVAAILFLSLPSCNNDDDHFGSLSPGDVKFDISGDIIESKSGNALARISEDQGNYTFQMSMDDVGSAGQTFSLIFYLGPETSPIELPAVGAYSLGLIGVGDMWLVYNDVQNELEYGSFWSVEGELTISQSTSSRIAGIFEFEAEGGELDGSGQPAGTIEVTNGQFNAIVQEN